MKAKGCIPMTLWKGSKRVLYWSPLVVFLLLSCYSIPTNFHLASLPTWTTFDGHGDTSGVLKQDTVKAYGSDSLNINNSEWRNISRGKTPANTAPTYPLMSELHLVSAERAYQNGFWQRMEPVPVNRWSVTANTTCVDRVDVETLPAWKRRVPSVLLIGSQKGGSTALAYFLYNHPHIPYLPTKELHFFDEELDQNPNIIVNSTLTNRTAGIPAMRALDYYQQTIIGSIIPLKKLELENQYVLDATPNYLFSSDRVPYRILCVAPWVKLLALLRNPVDRAFSQYNMQFNRDLTKPKLRRGYATFEQYVDQDLAVLKETGVILSSTVGTVVTEAERTAHAGSLQEFLAWSNYTKLGLNSPIGRGLYALQLRHWFQAMDEYEKPRSDLWVTPSSRLLRHPNETYAEIIQHLGLAPHELPKYGSVHTTTYRVRTMQPETREKLHAFYAPYNRQLEDLLGVDWHNIWEEG